MNITKTLRPLSGYSGWFSLSWRRSCLYSKRSSPISEEKCWEADWSKDNINRFTLNDKNDGGVWAITIWRWENHCWVNMTSRNISEVSPKVKLLIRITMTSLVSDDRGKSTRHQGFRLPGLPNTASKRLLWLGQKPKDSHPMLWLTKTYGLMALEFELEVKQTCLM